MRQNHLNSSHFCSPYIGSTGIGLLTIFTIFSDFLSSPPPLLSWAKRHHLSLDYCALLTGFTISALTHFRLNVYPGSAFSNKNQFMSIICSNPLPPHSFPRYLEKHHKVLAMFSKDSWDLANLSVTIPWWSHFLIPLQPHWSSCSSRNTPSQRPQVDTLHLLSSLSGRSFPGIHARLVLSPPSDLCSGAISSSLTTLMRCILSLSSLLCYYFSWFLSPSNILHVL